MAYTHQGIPFANGSVTSLQAALNQTKDKADKDRLFIYGQILHSSLPGFTDDELDKAFGLGLNTIRPRRIELVRAGYIVDSGTTRKTRTGNWAGVWVVVDPAKGYGVPVGGWNPRQRLTTKQKLEEARKDGYTCGYSDGFKAGQALKDVVVDVSGN